MRLVKGVQSDRWRQKCLSPAKTYDRYYRDYYPIYIENENGEMVESPRDWSRLGYTFDEETIDNLVENFNLVVPSSEREQ